MIHFGLRTPLFEENNEGGQGGGGGAAALDEKTIRGWIDKSVNGLATRLTAESQKTTTAFSEKFDAILARLESGGQQQGNQGGQGQGQGQGQGTQSALPPEIKAQLDSANKQVTDLTKKFELSEKAREEAAQKAELTERQAKLRGELGKYPILPESQDLVFDMFAGKVSRSEDGTLVVGETTMEAYIKDQLEKLPGLLTPVQKTGTGTTNPNGGAKGRIQLEDIKSGMSKEQMNQAAAEIARLAGAGPR